MGASVRPLSLILLLAAGLAGLVLSGSFARVEGGIDSKGPASILVHCPAVQAPRVTELQDGRVKLFLSVAADGSVSSSTVISSSGHGAWVEAAQEAVMNWRYPAGTSPHTREISLEFRLDHR